MKTRFVCLSALGLGLLGVACAGNDDGAVGGAAGSGAIPATGGSAGTSVTPSGGTATGGVAGTPTSSVPGTGGTPSSGGVPVSGGAAGSSGVPDSGGVAAGSGGVSGSDGVSGGGGLVETGGEGLGGTGGAAVGGTGGGGSGGEGTAGAGGSPVVEPTLITSGPGAYWQEGEVTVGGGSPTVTVNADQKNQDWYGFGGTFNEKGWDVLKGLSEADRDRAIHLLFDVRDGCGFSWGRIPIGSSDYGLTRYSLDDTPNDYEMANFSIDHDQQNLIPYIKAALAVKPDIRFWASPWSPPPWMKDNNSFDRGNMKSDDQTLTAHALYLARFVEEYAKEGINIEAVHPQNEPGYPQDYPSCSWSASLFANYIANYMGPTFASRLPDVGVWLGTMSNPNSSQIVSSVMGDQTARGYVKGIGLQWGMGDGNQPSQYSDMYGVHIMQTEHKCGNFPPGQNPAPNDHAYAVESWGYFKNWIGKGVNSYMAWNMVLDPGGLNLDAARPWHQNALLVVDGSQLVITPTYYLFRHLAQYVEPGAVRVGTQGGDALAFLNPDGSIVTVIYNSGAETQMTISVGGENLQFSMPGQGWATVNWQG